MHRIRFFSLALAALLAWDARAQGERPVDGDVEAARAYTKKGLSFYELGKYSDALEALELAYQKKPVPALLFNIAQCHRQLGHLEQAARLYKSYLRSEPPEAAARQTHELLTKVEEALAKHSTAVQSAPQELKDAMAKREPVPDAALRSAPPAAREHARWPALAAGGVAAGALTFGVVSALGSRSAANTLTQLHRSGPVDSLRDAALRGEVSSKYSRSKILYAASAVAAVAGVGLFFAF